MGNSRAVKNWIEEKVDPASVAPHRYTWDRVGPEDALAAPGDKHSIREWREALPYQPTEVIWVERSGQPVLARIQHIVVGYDRFGDRQAIYQCQTATAAGVWSKVWMRFYPGHVQRGYHLAGLAPDLEGKV
jgi:hypothetical protein